MWRAAVLVCGAAALNFPKAATAPEYPSCAEGRTRTRAILNVHFQHGAGSFVCGLAKKNCERVWEGNCNIRGDGGISPHHIIRRDCDFRARELAIGGATFSGLERGLLSGEFCPAVYDYMVLLREPLDRLLTRPAPSATVVVWLKAQLRGRRSLAGTKRPPPPKAPAREKNATLAALLEDGAALRVFDNFYTRSLCADSAVYEAAFGTVGEAAYARALANLETFKFVTTLDLVEAYPDASARVMADSVLGWRNFSSRAVNRHSADVNVTSDVLDADDRAALRALNAWDHRLWAYADRRTRREAGVPAPNATDHLDGRTTGT